MSYTEAQLISQALTPKFSAFLSLLGSTAIIVEIRSYYNEQDQVNTNTPGTSHRKNRDIDQLLVGMSISDLFFSLGWFMTTWPSPAETTTYVWGAVGNTATCSAQGTIISIGFWATPVYNTVISLCYMLIIVKSWSEERLMKLACWAHPLIWIMVLANAFTLLSLGLFNNYGVICYVQSLPIGCKGDECVRGFENAWKVALFTQIFPIWPALVLNICFMTRIYLSVREADRRSAKYASAPSKRKEVMEVGVQALCYIGAMLFTFIPDAVYATIYYLSNERSYFNFWFETVAYICLPLQGFLNFLIFMRQRKTTRTSLGRALMRCSSLCCYCCRVCFGRKPETTEREDTNNTSTVAVQGSTRRKFGFSKKFSSVMTQMARGSVARNSGEDFADNDGNV